MKNKRRLQCAIFALTMAMLTFSACTLLGFLPPTNGSSSYSSESSSSIEQDILTPPLPPPTSAGFINSLDKLNYYAARKTIDDHLGNKAVKSIGNAEEFSGEDFVDSVYGEDTSELPEYHDSMETDSVDTQRPQDTDTKRYYDLYNFGAFTVKCTIYFQIELTDETAFLATRLGAGRVEVAISIGELYDDLNMITFRNGDKFFSCMYHGYYGKNLETHADKFSFAAYRYIEGFYYVQDLEYEHYEFYIEASPIKDVVFTCDYHNTGFENEPVTVVENSTYYIEKKVSYTIEELEEYFNPSIQLDSASELTA